MNLRHSWVFFALGSALFAGLTAFFGKIGVAGINSNLATFIRTIVILGVTAAILTLRAEWRPATAISSNTWTYLTLSGIATGLSWLCYYRAVQLGPVSKVAPIDKLSIVFAIVLGIPLGLWAGLKPNSLAGRSIMAGSILGFSLPTFWVGLMLIMVFSVMLGWLPSNGRGPTTLLFGVPVSFTSIEGWRHLILPATNLALFKLALLIRLTRAGTREALLQDYVKFARAKGLSNARVIGVHVLRNILIPVVTVIGLEFGSVIAFAIVTESVFAWPGMGKLLVDSINLLDRPIIVAYLLVIVVMFVVINLIVDVLYSALDPRVRLAESRG